MSFQNFDIRDVVRPDGEYIYDAFYEVIGVFDSGSVVLDNVTITNSTDPVYNLIDVTEFSFVSLSNFRMINPQTGEGRLWFWATQNTGEFTMWNAEICGFDEVASVVVYAKDVVVRDVLMTDGYLSIYSDSLLITDFEL